MRRAPEAATYKGEYSNSSLRSSLALDSCVKHPKHSHIFAAYSYYNVATTVDLKLLMKDCLTMSREEGCDVFNALNVMDNDEFLHDLRFGMGDGNLNYYLFNWKCADVNPEEIGLVLL